MKASNKLISAVLVLCVLLFSASASATAENTPSLTARDCTAAYGSNFSIPIGITDNKGLMGFGIEVYYDSDLIAPVSVSASDLTGVGIFNDSISTSEKGSYKIFWSSTENMTENGKICVLTFKAISNRSAAAKVRLNVLQDETFDENYNDYLLNGCNVSVDIKSTSGEETPVENKIGSAENIRGYYGKTLTVPVKIENNTGIMAYKILISYDKTALEPVMIESGDIFSGYIDNSISENSGQFFVIWCGTANQYSNGVLFSIKFNVISREKTDTAVRMEYSQKDTFDENYADVTLNFDNIPLLLNQYDTGDINLDGKVNSSDLTALRKYLLGVKTLQSDEYGMADVNGDKKVDIIDLIRLKKIVAGIFNG